MKKAGPLTEVLMIPFKRLNTEQSQASTHPILKEQLNSHPYVNIFHKLKWF